ncbi:hypothetical protein [Corynebacterium sp. NML130628]|uniref:glutamine amidotransferase-related protein n=1 Tax=Corynebacterium sp. NML130628 TaxID=1906333 RepID=UPI0008FB42A7|nr:hypothetical protein [Corynebacterium sp. NML130628]
MILLIDNRDSYTFNLAHMLAANAGEEPLVVGAEDVETLDIPDRIRAGEFTHIVISPGPGHPGKATDFGGAKRVIEAADGIPLLGVCLGHRTLHGAVPRWPRRRGVVVARVARGRRRVERYS